MCLRPYLAVEKNNKFEIIKKEEFKKYFWNNFDNEKNGIIKCGKCKECLQEKQLELIQRIKMEKSFWKDNTVITATYNNENLKNLNIKDLQKFYKRMRNNGYKIRYFHAGELGETTKRPHYHIILFNYKPKDEEFYKETKKGTKQYISSELNKIWGMGLVTHGLLSDKAIYYVVKYMLKGLGKKDTLYGWSRKPPLGINPDMFEKLKNLIKTKKHLPKCFKDYYERLTGEEIKLSEEEIEERHQAKMEKIANIEKQTGESYKKYLEKRAKYLTK